MTLTGLAVRVRASILAMLAGWLTAFLATMPMQVFQIVQNNLGGLRSLLWSLAAGMYVWLIWTLIIAAGGWLLGCVPAVLVIPEKWLLRRRRWVLAASAIMACAAVMTLTRTWRFFSPDYTFHPWLFSLYTLLLLVFAVVTAAAYLRLIGREAGR